jgi:hypothetical protein
MVLDVKSVDRLLGTPVPYAYAIKAGPWIFLTGREAYAGSSSVLVIGPLSSGDAGRLQQQAGQSREHDVAVRAAYPPQPCRIERHLELVWGRRRQRQCRQVPLGRYGLT